jgi:hypothetical protein
MSNFLLVILILALFAAFGWAISHPVDLEAVKHEL